MEEIVGILGFSLGASLAMSAVRGLRGGLRPAARGLVKSGLALGDAVSGLTAEARQSLNDLHAEAKAERGGAGPTSAAPQRIVIARE